MDRGHQGTRMHVNVEKIANGTPDVIVDAASLPPYGNSTLPPAIRSLIVNNVNGLTVHMLEAGFDTEGRPCVLFCMAFRSWPLAGAK